MDRLSISGGRPLHGVIRISGAKNSSLPLMAASLLTDEQVTFCGIPHLSDIVTMSKLLVNHGVNINTQQDFTGERKLCLRADKITNLQAPYDIVRKMRASIWVLGPLLARFGSANVSLPGGCAIGVRPINLHLEALEKMGAVIALDQGYINASCKGRLQGAEIHFPFVSVGATANTLMAATLAEGRTVIYNAATEPEIADLSNMLIKMGAKIFGIGTSTITIDGVEKLHGTTHTVIPDRIEAGTYAVAAVITGGELMLENVDYESIVNVVDILEKVGAKISKESNGIKVKASKKLEAIDIQTGPYPNFSTDMQAQIMSLLTVAKGTSTIVENIFENRYMHVSELNRMGADISVKGSAAIVRGVKNLYGAEVMATDLRASVSLVLAALVAEGKTIINRVYHLDRGYESLEEKLSKCGAVIERIS